MPTALSISILMIIKSFLHQQK